MSLPHPSSAQGPDNRLEDKSLSELSDLRIVGCEGLLRGILDLGVLGEALSEPDAQYSFPGEVLPDKAEAKLEEGVLTLRAPKKEASIEACVLAHSGQTMAADGSP